MIYMRQILITLLVIGLLLMTVNADEIADKKDNKPPCCIEFPFLNSTLNVLKDNICMGMAAGLPIAIMLVVSVITFIVFLFVWLILAIAGADTSSVGTSAIVTVLALTGLSFVGGIAANILVPFYDYNEKTLKKIWENPVVIIERVAGWVISVGTGILIIMNISNANSSN